MLILIKSKCKIVLFLVRKTNVIGNYEIDLQFQRIVVIKLQMLNGNLNI